MNTLIYMQALLNNAGYDSFLNNILSQHKVIAVIGKSIIQFIAYNSTSGTSTQHDKAVSTLIHNNIT